MSEAIEWKISSYTPHPPGSFRGKLVKYEKTQSAPEYGGGDRVRLVIETDAERDEEDAEEGPLSISVWGSPTLSTRGWVGKFLLAHGVTPEQLKDKEFLATFDLDDYLNRAVGVTVVHELNQKGEMRDKVAGFYPLKKKRAQETQPVRAAAHEAPAVPRSSRLAEEDEEEQAAKQRPAAQQTAGKDVFADE